jgi:hypothetical protein
MVSSSYKRQNVVPLRPSLIALSLCVSACGLLPGKSPATSANHANQNGENGTNAAIGLPVQRFSNKPSLVVVEREGDPQPWIAFSVRLPPDSVISETLGALLESRLSRQLQIPVVLQTHQDGFHLGFSVSETISIPQLLSSIRTAMLTPFVMNRADVALVDARLKALRVLGRNRPHFAGTVSCTGEAQLDHQRQLPSMMLSSTWTQIESWRKDAFTTERVAVSFVGPHPKIVSFGQAYASHPDWPHAPALPLDSPKGAPTTLYVNHDIDSKHARLSVSFRFPTRADAIKLAERSLHPRMPLIARLKTLPIAFRVSRFVSTVRPAGSCFSLEVTSEETSLGSKQLQEVSAIASAVIQQEIDIERKPTPGDFGLVERRIRALPSTQEMAAAAGWWALTSDSATPSAVPQRIVALGIPSRSFPKGSNLGTPFNTTKLDAAPLQQQLDLASQRFQTPVVERQIGVERGQGEVWMLLGQPCPLVETQQEAGLSALALSSMAIELQGDRGIQIEPWISAHGVGLIGHATIQDQKETPEQLSERIGDVLARLYFARGPSSAGLVQARRTLTEFLSDPIQRSRSAAISTLIPNFVTQSQPWGLLDVVESVGYDATRIRWEALTQGPLRVAVLANASNAQGQAGVNAVDRWIVRSSTQRTCPALGSAPTLAAGVYSLENSWQKLAVSYLVVPLVTAEDHAELTKILLTSGNSMLPKVLGNSGVQSEVRVVGMNPGTQGLMIELRGQPQAVEDATQQVRALLKRLEEGAVLPVEFQQAKLAWSEQQITSKGSAKHRLVALWNKKQPKTQEISLASLKSWLAKNRLSSHVMVVRTQPSKVSKESDSVD